MCRRKVVRFACLVGVIVLLGFHTAFAGEPPEGFVSLFNGKDLDGWKRHDNLPGHGVAGKWVVEDGAIVGMQDPPGKGGFLTTLRTYEDFELRLETKIDWPFDSGVFLRVGPEGKSHQVTLDYRPGGQIGGIYCPWTRGYVHHCPDGIKHFKKDQWNDVRIVCRGEPAGIRVWLNDTLITDFRHTAESTAGIGKAGTICLQIHPGGKDVDENKARFRNIFIRELRRSGDMSEKIKAFCIDFNWGPGGPNSFAEPGLWADASPQEHVKWYKNLGVNTIQTFCVSCNGYAWYKGGIVPEQLGLKTDFLAEVVTLGQKEGMRVMGYFCVGANTLWGQRHPELSYGIISGPHIPFTKEYLDYLTASIKDALTKTGIDGFMIDWVWMPKRDSTGGKWLACEKKLYEDLMGRPFPGEDKLTEEQETRYARKAIDRCWAAIHKAAKETRPDCIIWLSCNKVDHPHVRNSKMFREIDWLMNEHPDPSALAGARKAAGPNTRIVQCLCGWGKAHDAAKVINDPNYADVGFYGYAEPDKTSFPPIAKSNDRKAAENARNIAIMKKAFNAR